MDGATPLIDEPMREEEGTLRVEVLSPTGPRPGARVTLYLRGAHAPTTGQPAWRLAGTGLTDEAGVAVLPARAGNYLVAARTESLAPARAEVTRPRGEASTTVRLTLDAGQGLEGSTVERTSRNPVPLVELTLTPRLSGSFYSRASAPEEERLSAVSDARGSFRFEGLTQGDYQLDARAPGHAPKRLARVHVPSSGVAVELEGSAFLAGFVEQADGTPAADASVSAFGADEAVVGVTGAGGGFSLDVPPGTYQLSARKGDKTGTAAGRLVVAAGMTLEGLRIRLGAPTSLVGVVRRKDSGQPIADAAIVLGPHGDRGDIAQASSGADGHFEVNGLAPGAYDVTVRARGFKALSRRGLTVLEGQRFELLAELDANGRIEGSVVDGEKKPLAGVQVTPQRKWGAMEGAVATVTDAMGAFVLEDMPPGDVYVAAARTGSTVNAREPVKVEPGQTARVRLQLSDEGVLEGTVRMAGGGLPARPVMVFAQRIGAPRSEGLEVPASANGTWSMRVGAGRYQLSAWMTDATAQSESQEQVIELKAGQSRHVALELHAAKKPIVVTVLEPNGAPSVRATVMGSEAGRSNILAERLTDESGRATLVVDGVGSDALHLWATNGGRRGDLLSVPSTRTAVTLQLEPGARLTGTVRSAGGRAVNGFTLLVTALRTEDEDFLTQQQLEFTGDRFVVEDVFASRVAITATLPDGRAGKAETTTPPGGTARVEVVVDAGGRLTGRLLDAKTGTPIRLAYVDVDGLRSPTTGEDGRFQLDDLAPGAHRVTVWSRGHALVDRQVTITAGKTRDLGDWSLGPTRVEPGRLGLTFGMSGNDVTISFIAEGAETGDLRVGDVVTAIDGATVLDPGEARLRELGAPGSPCTLMLRRDGRTLSLTLTRAK
ncbi:Hypothetical protein AA314_03131 [Archangium gephyra]|nr:Hypothetical protein AA314_03131 [Archangium gephyra]